MKLIHNKSFNDISESSYKKLSSIGLSTDDGSIVRLFTDLINGNISEFYEELEDKHSQVFLTTATDRNLDNIGLLLNCKRLSNETDNSYRKRISNQVMYLTAANETSIRLAILNIDNVKDVIMRKFTNGPGSFTVIPICDDYSESMIGTVESVVNSMSSYGEKVIVRPPTEKLVKLNISLILNTALNDSERNELRVYVSKQISNYINSIRAGGSIIINELTNIIMNSSDKIANYNCNNIRINNKEVLFINQSSRWDEKFRISRDENSLLVN